MDFVLILASGQLLRGQEARGTSALEIRRGRETFVPRGEFLADFDFWADGAGCQRTGQDQFLGWFDISDYE